jgi:WD40 repeat protein
LPEDSAARTQLARLRKVVKAAHFCQASSRNFTPQAFAESIANQLTGTVKGFGQALAATLSDRVNIVGTVLAGTAATGSNLTGVAIDRIDLATLDDEPSFDRAFVQPIKKLYESGHRDPMLLLVDALDEAQTYTGKIKLSRLLSGIADLPPGVRILAATRDDPDMLQFFRGAPRFDLIRDAPPDVDDVRDYARQRLKSLANVGDSKRGEFAERLAKQAQGIFLYAALVLNDLLELPTSHLPDLETYGLPEGLGGIYHDFLTRELGEVRQAWSDRYRPLLGLLAVAQGEGLNCAQLARILNREPDEVGDTLRRCKQYLSGELPNGPFRPFHKSFADFLFEDKQNCDFHVDAMQWHKTLLDHYTDNFSGRWVDCDAYGFAYLLVHAIEAGKRNCVDRLFEDTEFLVFAEPDSVMRASSQLTSDRARDISLAYGHVANLFRDRTIRERRSYLNMSLLQNGISCFGTIGIPVEGPAAPWIPLWANCEPTIRYFPIVGHSEAISAIASGYLHDAIYVAAGDVSGNVRLSNMVTGATIGEIPNRRGFRINVLASYSQSNESMIVIGDSEGMIECWDLYKMQRRWGTNEYHWNTRDIVILSAQNQHIVASCSDNAIYALELRSGEGVGPFGESWNLRINNDKFDKTTCLASYVAARGLYLLSGHRDGMLRVWDFRAGTVINKVKVDDFEIQKIDVIEWNGDRVIVLAGLGRSIRILDCETLACLVDIQRRDEPTMSPVIAFGDLGNQKLLYSVEGRGIAVFSLPDGRKVSEINAVEFGWISVIARVQCNGAAKIVLGSDNRSLYVIDERELFRSTGQRVEKSRVTAVCRVNMGGSFLACGHSDGLIQLRDWESGHPLGGLSR